MIGKQELPTWRPALLCAVSGCDWVPRRFLAGARTLEDRGRFDEVPAKKSWKFRLDWWQLDSSGVVGRERRGKIRKLI